MQGGNAVAHVAFWTDLFAHLSPIFEVMTCSEDHGPPSAMRSSLSAGSVRSSSPANVTCAATIGRH